VNWKFESKGVSSMQHTRDSRYLFIPVLALALMTGVSAAMAQTGLPARDDLAGLKNALEIAGAPALTSTQDSSLKTLIADFRNASKPSPNTALQTARAAYENAILSGDNATAASQALVIGSAQSAEMVKRESDAAIFAIHVVNILKTEGGQLEALIAKMGSSGTARLLLSLAGGPGGPGRGGPGGPGGPGAGGRGPAGMRPGPPPVF
jgi:hypothetical protein